MEVKVQHRDTNTIFVEHRSDTNHSHPLGDSEHDWTEFMQLHDIPLADANHAFVVYRDAQAFGNLMNMMWPEIHCLLTIHGKQSTFNVNKAVNRQSDGALCILTLDHVHSLECLETGGESGEPMHVRLCIPNIQNAFASHTKLVRSRSSSWALQLTRSGGGGGSAVSRWVPDRLFVVEWPAEDESDPSTTTTTTIGKHSVESGLNGGRLVLEMSGDVESPGNYEFLVPPPLDLARFPGLVVHNVPAVELKFMFAQLGAFMWETFWMRFNPKTEVLCIEAFGTDANALTFELRPGAAGECTLLEHKHQECVRFQCPDGVAAFSQEYKQVSSVSALAMLKLSLRFHVLFAPGAPLILVSPDGLVAIHLALALPPTAAASASRSLPPFFDETVQKRASTEVDDRTLLGDLLHADSWDYTLRRNKRIEVREKETSNVCFWVRRQVRALIIPAFTPTVWQRYGYTPSDISTTFQEPVKPVHMWPVAIVNRISLDPGNVKSQPQSDRSFTYGSKLQSAKKIIAALLPTIADKIGPSTPPSGSASAESHSALCRLNSEQHIPMIPLMSVSSEVFAELRSLIPPTGFTKQRITKCTRLVPYRGVDGSEILVLPRALDLEDPRLLRMTRVIPQHVHLRLYGQPQNNYEVPTCVQPEGSSEVYTLTPEEFFLAEPALYMKNQEARKVVSQRGGGGGGARKGAGATEKTEKKVKVSKKPAASGAKSKKR